jgi:hypothetical protein
MIARIEIRMDNDAFHPNPFPELASILGDLARLIGDAGDTPEDSSLVMYTEGGAISANPIVILLNGYPLRDTNGNTVGWIEITEGDL